jgi:hypothetical protein
MVKDTKANETSEDRLNDLEVKVNRRLYILYYRFRSSIPFSKVFPFDGPLVGAAERGKKHCELMGYSFVIVRPFIVDLEHQEKRKLDDPNYVD